MALQLIEHRSGGLGATEVGHTDYVCFLAPGSFCQLPWAPWATLGVGEVRRLVPLL